MGSRFGGGEDGDAVGVLTVTERGVSKEVKLDFPELRNGIVLLQKPARRSRLNWNSF